MEPLRGDEPPGAPRRVAIDRCACQVVAWLPAELSDFVDAAGVPAPLYRVEYETPDATRRDATGLGASVAGDVEDLEEHELQESQRSPNGEPEFGGFGAVVDVAPRGRVWAAFADDPRQTWYGGTVISRSKQTGDLRVVFDDGQSMTVHVSDVFAHVGAGTLALLKLKEPNARARAVVRAHLG